MQQNQLPIIFRYWEKSYRMGTDLIQRMCTGLHNHAEACNSLEIDTISYPTGCAHSRCPRTARAAPSTENAPAKTNRYIGLNSYITLPKLRAEQEPWVCKAERLIAMLENH